MKIAQVVSTPPFAWETGGGARVTYEISKALSRHGHEVQLLTLDLQNSNLNLTGKGYCKETIDGIDVYKFRHLGKNYTKKNKIFVSPDLIRYLKHNIESYDVVHLQDLISFQAVGTSYYCKKNHVPYVLTTHGSVPWLLGRRLPNKLYSNIGRWVCDNAAMVLALNDTEVELYKRIGIESSKITVIPNGINVSDYTHLPDAGMFKSKYRIPSNDKIILYLGRVHESKGIDLLVDSFKEIAKKRNDVKLVIAGPDDGFLSRLIDSVDLSDINDSVIFTGYISHEDKLAALRDAAVLVIPKFTGFPVTFLESCICGTPIVTTNAGDCLDWVKNAGYVVKYDKRQMAQVLTCILDDPSLRQTLGENAWKLAKTEFNYEIIIGEIEKIYISCISM